jgi:hypothetical protein
MFLRNGLKFKQPEASAYGTQDIRTFLKPALICQVFTGFFNDEGNPEGPNPASKTPQWVSANSEH